MRNAFVNTLTELAAQDRRIVLLTGDLGFMVLEPFAQAFPDRFINMGVAEANMMSVAAGLASRGLLPFCYSIATFASMRGYEQLRDGAVLHGSRVRVVAVGGGYSYGSAGTTHHALEDIALMRVQPRLNVFAPADDAQTITLLRQTYSDPMPIYYRLGKSSVQIPELQGRFGVGHLELLDHGDDVLLVTMGGLTKSVVTAAEVLRKRQIGASVAITASITPAPEQELVRLMDRFRLVITVEDHYLRGGLGSMVAEIAADHGKHSRLIRMGISRAPDGRSGSEEFLLTACGLAPDTIVTTASDALKAANPAGSRGIT